MQTVVLTKENTARVTLKNPNTSRQEQLLVYANPHDIAAAVVRFARQHRITPSQVDVATIWPDRRAR